MIVRVNIVVGSSDLHWIAGRFARELVQRLPQYGVHAEINEASMRDLEYQQIVYGEPTHRPAIGMFTHGDFRPRRYASAYDGQIALSPVMQDFLITGGATAPALILPCVDASLTPGRKLVFGVAGRTYSDGRKGEMLVAAMVAAGYDVRAWGHGWPCQIVATQINELPAFYQTLDYYVDTSTDEGGCIPALEAMAMGIPVISHTVGVTRPVLAYERGSWADLSRVLTTLTVPRTYNDWAREHAAYFKQVLARVAVAA